MQAYKLVPSAILLLNLPTPRTKPESYRLDLPSLNGNLPKAPEIRLALEAHCYSLVECAWYALYLERSPSICKFSETSTEALRKVRRGLRLVFICLSISACPKRTEGRPLFLPPGCAGGCGLLYSPNPSIFLFLGICENSRKSSISSCRERDSPTYDWDLVLREEHNF